MLTFTLSKHRVDRWGGNITSKSGCARPPFKEHHLLKRNAAGIHATWQLGKNWYKRFREGILICEQTENASFRRTNLKTGNLNGEKKELAYL